MSAGVLMEKEKPGRQTGFVSIHSLKRHRMNSNTTTFWNASLLAALAEEHSAQCTEDENKRRRENGRASNVGERCIIFRDAPNADRQQRQPEMPQA